MSSGQVTRHEKLNDMWMDPATGCYYRDLGIMDKLQIMVYHAEQPRMISMDEYIRKYSHIDLALDGLTQEQLKKLKQELEVQKKYVQMPLKGERFTNKFGAVSTGPIRKVI